MDSDFDFDHDYESDHADDYDFDDDYDSDHGDDYDFDDDYDSDHGYSSSSPSSPPKTAGAKSEVFLNFRGDDTRDGFISHLHKDLRHNKGIETFIDNNDLQRGDKISESLMKAIENSRIAIVVFSKDYASSTWCLEELAKIIDCQESRDLIVLPVFYHVDPSDVRKQSGIFEEAFKRHEERFEDELEKVQRWRIALTKAAHLSGFDSEVIKPESTLVDKVVDDVLSKLNHSSTSDNKDLVGVKYNIRKIESLLCIQSKEVFAVGIWGMGGIGKTTLASAIFHKIKSKFDGAYFQRNVREESNLCRLSIMQEKFLSKVLKDKHATLESTLTKNRLSCKKILIILDDVTNVKQMEDLIGKFEYFGCGSRIIITSRDKQVLRNCGIIEKDIHKVGGLPYKRGLELFCRYAFKQKNPVEGYMELSERMVKLINGVPLALIVCGSLLFQKSKSEWENLMPHIESKEIQDVLELSYKELTDDEKDLFLDIACFLKNVSKKHAVEILKANWLASDARIDAVIEALIEKSLINITKLFFYDMHDLLEEMGKKIVIEESKDPGKHSRLWHHEDIIRVLTCNTGTEAIEAIHLDTSNLIRNIDLNPCTFLKMPYLKLLDIFPSSRVSLFSVPSGSSSFGSPKVLASEGLNLVCTELRYLRWFRYPLEKLPSKFDPRNLVVLIMPQSNIEQLGNDFRRFIKLKRMDLSHSKNLTSILCLPSNLERLILVGCSSLTEINPSIQYLNKIVMLDLKDCANLEILPTSLLKNSESLVYISLSGCSNLKIALKITSGMRYIYLDGTTIEEFPLVEDASSIQRLYLPKCSRLKSLPGSCALTMCKSSTSLMVGVKLNLLRFTELERLPNDLGHMEDLLEIEAGYTAIREVPSSIIHCKSLCRLSFRGCKGGQELVDSALPLLSYLKSLYYLDLSYCQITNLPDCLGQLSSLEELYLRKNKFEIIPGTIEDLINLRTLNVSNCTSLQSLPKLPGGVKVKASNCKSLKALPYFSLEQQFNLAKCFELDRHDFKAQVENGLLEFQSNFKLDSETFVDIYYPGNEIPEFFNLRSMRSSVTLELPPDRVKKKRSDFCPRFLVCVVVTSRGRPSGFFPRIRMHCKAVSKNGKMEESHTHSIYHMRDLLDDLDVGCWTMKYHVILCTASLSNWRSIDLYDRVTLTFDIVGCQSIRVKNCGVVRYQNIRVQKCGVKLLDLTDEEPQTKRLKL